MNRQLVVTGVGYKERKPIGSGIDVFGSPDVKPNMGACVALRAATLGYQVNLVARTALKLENVCGSILQRVPSAIVHCRPTDVLDPESVRKLVQDIPTQPELDIVQCAGASAGSFHTPGDNLFYSIEETPHNMLMLEFEGVVKSLLILVQQFLPRLKAQARARLVVITSMAGFRAFPFGFSHCAGKGALHQAVRTLALELNPFGIRVSEVAPGVVDTGMYDTPEVDSIIRKISHEFNYHYPPGKFPEMTPHAVADAVLLCLTSDSHVLSVNMVSDGQIPHHGS
jgi:3-hydroxy acid dehydrogenase/malonic semialdehyde reductase